MSDITSPAEQTDLFCADLSLETREPMAGTAPAVDLWLLLEYSGPWAAKATEDNDLPPATQAWLAQAVAEAGRGRVLFIKQNRPTPTAAITFFIALNREVAPLLYQFRLNTYDDLYELDMAGLLIGDAGHEHLRSEPLYLVCTNGRRDRCCSRLGPSLYRAMDEHVGDAAWQCTHLGGHRFAPALLTFPNGACYGRLTAADIAPLIRAQEAGELYLSHLRGRCCYDEVIQAAEWFLRQKTGLRVSGDYRLLDAVQGDETQWLVRFIAPSSGEIQLVTLNRTLSGPARLVSCNPPKSKLVPQFHLVSTEKQ